MASPGRRLAEMLADSWEIKGFQPTIDADFDDGAAASATAGYVILLQRRSQAAIARVKYDKGDMVVFAISILTETE